MKSKFLYIILFSIFIYLSSILYNFVIPFILTMIVLYKRRSIIFVEIGIAILSFIILTSFHKVFVYSYTLRALTLINLFLIASYHTDKSSILDLLGSKGVLVVIALSYYPLFYEIVQKIMFYSRIRKISLFNIKRILLPAIVEIVKIAENLYYAYTLKLFGKYSYKSNIRPNKYDVIFLALGVISLCFSYILHI